MQRASLSLLALSLWLLPACNGASTPTIRAEVPVVGVFGDRLDGHLDLEIVDDVTGAPLDLPAILSLADGTTREVSAGAIDDAALAPPISITVLAPGHPQRWEGVAGSHVIFGVGRYRMGRLHGTVLPEEGNEIRLRPIGPARLVRTEQFDRSDSASVSLFEGTFDIESPETSIGVAAVVYDDGEPVAVAIGTGSAARGAPAMTLDARTAREHSVSRDVTLPAHATAEVVGVPGISLGDHVALLGYSAMGHLVVPDLPDARFWVMARAASVGRGRETAVLQRGLSSLDEVGEWPAWLDFLDATDLGDGSLSVEVPAGATLLSVDWYSSDAPVASVLVIAPTPTVTLVPPDLGFVPSMARVRALDVPGVRDDALDLAAVDATTIRYSDVDASLDP